MKEIHQKSKDIFFGICYKMLPLEDQWQQLFYRIYIIGKVQIFL